MLLAVLLAAAASGLLAALATPWLRQLADDPPPAWWHVALATALGAWAGLAFGLSWALLGFVALAVVWSMAAVIDFTSLRLPDALTLPSYPGLLVLLLPALLTEDAPLLRVALAGLATAAALFVVGWIAPRSFGLGDVKLGLTTGAVLGWWGWRAVLLGAGAAFVAFAVVGLALLALKRVGRRTELPFGPFLIVGALLGPLLA